MNALAHAASSGNATAADWLRFLRPIVAGVRNPPSEGDCKARAVALAAALPNVPAAWLAQTWRQAEAMRKFAFWPAVADFAEMFEPELRDARESADRRLRLAAPAPDFDGPPLRSAEEILAVKAKARALVAELTATRPEDRATSPVRPAPISDGAMLEHYRQLAARGNGPAAVRVAQIEERLGLDA